MVVPSLCSRQNSEYPTWLHRPLYHHSADYIFSFGIIEPVLVTLKIEYRLRRCWWPGASGRGAYAAIKPSLRFASFCVFFVSIGSLLDFYYQVFAVHICLKATFCLAWTIIKINSSYLISHEYLRIVIIRSNIELKSGVSWRCGWWHCYNEFFSSVI